MTCLLLVEDDERISQPLVRLLQHEGFEVTHVALGRDALAAVNRQPPELVLLDLTLPDIDGLEVCRSLRTTHPGLPIVMLTARDDEVDVVVGLDAGADDYIAKPFRVASWWPGRAPAFEWRPRCLPSPRATPTTRRRRLRIDLNARRCGWTVWR